jgi:hypothetical protein
MKSGKTTTKENRAGSHRAIGPFYYVVSQKFYQTSDKMYFIGMLTDGLTQFRKIDDVSDLRLWPDVA